MLQGFRLLGILDVQKTPCAREAILHGAGGSLAVGLLHFLATSEFLIESEQCVCMWVIFTVHFVTVLPSFSFKMTYAPSLEAVLSTVWELSLHNKWLLMVISVCNYKLDMKSVDEIFLTDPYKAWWHMGCPYFGNLDFKFSLASGKIHGSVLLQVFAHKIKRRFDFVVWNTPAYKYCEKYKIFKAIPLE